MGRMQLGPALYVSSGEVRGKSYSKYTHASDSGAMAEALAAAWNREGNSGKTQGTIDSLRLRGWDRRMKRGSKRTYRVSTEVLQEALSDFDLCKRLGVALGAEALHQMSEEVCHL